jgi:FkbM family methyltransferase
MSKERLLQHLGRVEKIAQASKWRRFLASPFLYSKAILHRILVFPITQKSISVKTRPFFDLEMHLKLPASTDIYLTGGKSHFSEIKLARFLIQHLETDHSFLDIGAHYGYFTLLATKLIGAKGTILAFEASPETYQILEQNLSKFNNVQTFQALVSNHTDAQDFYVFPNLYSEYNSFGVDAYKNEAWFKKYPPNKIKIPSIRIDDLIKEKNIHPDFIKIDVEGAEYEVLLGLQTYLDQFCPTLMMEYLAAAQNNSEHKKAENFLLEKGYKPYSIQENGALIPIKNADSFLETIGEDSDNIVYKKVIHSE